MIKEAIEKILSLAAPVITTVDDERLYSDKDLIPIIPPHPSALTVSTLDSLAKYIQDNPDRLTEVIICIDGPHQVSVFSPLDETWRNREPYLVAKDTTPQFHFNDCMDVASFIVGVQVHFDDNEARQALLKVVGNITESAVRTHADDGVTQTVTAKAGITRVEDVDVPRILPLAVRRTFYEIGAIPGDFILRLRSAKEGAPTCALFETAARVWEREAVIRIYEYIGAKKFPIPVTLIG